MEPTPNVSPTSGQSVSEKRPNFFNRYKKQLLLTAFALLMILIAMICSGIAGPSDTDIVLEAVQDKVFDLHTCALKEAANYTLIDPKWSITKHSDTHYSVTLRGIAPSYHNAELKLNIEVNMLWDDMIITPFSCYLMGYYPDPDPALDIIYAYGRY